MTIESESNVQLDLPVGQELRYRCRYHSAQHEDIAKEVMRTVTEPLAAHASLTSLDMSNNAMGLKGMVAIERLLCERRDTLYHLYFNNCGNEADAVEHLGRCLLPTPESTTKLRTLQMARNCLVHAGCDEVTKIVARSPLLTSLRVSGTRVPMKGMQHLVEVGFFQFV
jgi:Ran GTPase-activating protein (RanGAP) involved in mRNA processing and transport